MARKNSIIAITISDAGVINFAVTGAGEFNLDPAALSDDVANRARLHGLVQKVSDAAAIAKAELPDDPTEAAKVKFAAMQAVAERLIEGDWSKRSGDGSGPVSGIIYRAFEEWAMARAAAAKKTLDPAAIRAAYDGKSRADQLALRNVPEIATIIERIKSERGPVKSVDAGELLSELGL